MNRQYPLATLKVAVRMVGSMVALLPSLLWGQTVPLPACSPGIPYYCADAACFLDGSEHTLEVYVGICNDALQFVKSRSGYKASADVLIVVHDDDNCQVTGDTYRIRLKAPSYDKTNSMDSCVTRAIRFGAEPGDFKMTIRVTDRDTSMGSIVRTEIEVPDLSTAPAMSDIVFLYAEPGRKDRRWPGYRPSIRRVFKETHGSVTFYYELYDTELTDSLQVMYEVIEDEDDRVFVSYPAPVRGPATAHVDKIPVDSLSNGRYLLKVSVTDPDGDLVLSRSEEFEVSTDTFYLGKDLEDAVALLHYIADRGFAERLVKAPQEERRTLWEQFWREKDPTPMTPRNEFYEEHLKRFKYADRAFRTNMSEGWRTDRGRIHIIYGPPDEIESQGMEIDQDPTEIWYYTSSGRTFVFVDHTGFGDYILANEL
jgi:GWxTD domain-containing protein